jgi:hypothetical protein
MIHKTDRRQFRQSFQILLYARELDAKPYRGFGYKIHAHQPDIPYLDHPCNAGRGRGIKLAIPVAQNGLIVSNQLPTGINQAQRKVRFA